MSAVPETAPARPADAGSRLAEFFEDVGVRQGLKMAIAGVLGFAIALWLRLPNPTWCIFTVIVLMLAQYVGAIAEKAVLRAIGTMAGAAIGILLVGNFANDPPVIIAGAFIVSAFGTMMFGGNWYPYAFFLGALTTLVVVGTTMEDPANTWHIGISRCLEILLGIVVSTAVTGVIWPRYARDEFHKCFRATLREAGEITTARSRRLLDNTEVPPSIAGTELRFVTRMNTLRLLLRYGQRESEYFRAKLPLRSRMIAALGALFEAAESLGQRLPEQSRYRDLISDELREIQTLLEREFAALTNFDVKIPLEPENAALAEAIRRCDAHLIDLRDRGLTKTIPVQEAMDFSSHYTALVDISARLRVIRECAHQIYATTESIAPAGRKRWARLKITNFWVRTGIKGGLTAVLALIYVNWINPPGGLTVPFAAWLLTATSRLYPGGEGDRRAFSYALVIALVGIPYSMLLFVIWPFLAHYFWMNIFLATGLFVLGLTFARQGGISLYGQCGMLFFIGAIGLNAQEPVTFPQVVNVYFGVVLSLLFSAVIQRMLWPLLPQREIFGLFREFFACCRQLLGTLTPEERSNVEERLALIPSEAAAWINVTTTPEYPAGESRRLLELLQTAERLSYCILSTRKLDEIDTPSEIKDRLRDHLTALETSYRETLAGFESTFERGPRPLSAPSLLASFQPLEAELGDIRQRYLSGEISFPAAIPYLGAMNFVEEAARTMDRCAEQIRGLALEKYRGDYAL
ncbi:MAG TPA: FUSC family protein [Chthoniobacterales bacterium]